MVPGVRQMAASWSVRTRFTSSGMDRLEKLRTPASTCAILSDFFAATSAAASVELTSPYTTIQSGA